MRQQLFGISLIFLAIVACQQKSSNGNPKEESQQVKVKEAQIEAKPAVLSDTLGIHKITHLEGREWIVEMSETIREMEQVIDQNNLPRMSVLMKKATENQLRQIAIQSSLSEPDRRLFKSYAHKLSDKLMELGDAMTKI